MRNHIDGRADVNDYYFRVFVDFKQDNHTTVQYLEMNFLQVSFLSQDPCYWPCLRRPYTPQRYTQQSSPRQCEMAKSTELENPSEIITPKFSKPYPLPPQPITLLLHFPLKARHVHHTLAPSTRLQLVHVSYHSCSDLLARPPLRPSAS